MVSIPNVAGGMIDKLVAEDLQPWASKAFRDSAKEVDWAKFYLHIMFNLRVAYKNFKESQVNTRIVYM